MKVEKSNKCNVSNAGIAHMVLGLAEVSWVCINKTE